MASSQGKRWGPRVYFSKEIEKFFWEQPKSSTLSGLSHSRRTSIEIPSFAGSSFLGVVGFIHGLLRNYAGRPCRYHYVTTDGVAFRDSCGLRRPAHAPSPSSSGDYATQLQSALLGGLRLIPCALVVGDSPLHWGIRETIR